MKPILEVENLVKNYDNNQVKAVDNISFSVNSGEFFCLLGTNGAGKSTTINIICTLLEKTNGDIWVDGFRVGAHDSEVRTRIGVVFQGNVLDDELTVKENLLTRASFYNLTAKQANERVEELTAKLSMHSFINQMYGELSGGQRRKCDVARALLARPKILFLDEPTTGLDPQSRQDLWSVVDEIRHSEKMTVILTTHYMEETEQADRIAIIDQGKVLAIDTPGRLKSKFSIDILRLIAKPGSETRIEALLPQFQKVADTYILKFKDGVEAIDLLQQIKPYLDSFELQKGNMDSVFLNVIGKEYDEHSL